MQKSTPNEVLALLAYGTPKSIDEVGPYLKDIRQGKAPSKEEVDNLAARYKSIGGTSPLSRITAQLALSTEHVLMDEYGSNTWVFIGMKHSYPTIAEMAKRIRSFGSVKRVVGLVLAPHFSSISVPQYGEKLSEFLKDAAEVEMVEKWYDAPGFAEMWASRISDCVAQADDPMVIFTAHSLPKQAMKEGDPYAEQVAGSVEAVAKAANLKKYDFAFQSGAGRPGWLVPDLMSKIRESKDSCKSFVIVPIGYVIDNLEILYDIDIEIKELCSSIGRAYYRPEMPNSSQELSSILARVYIEKTRKG